MLNRQPYTGERKLILAFDIGTTFSGISYCLLEPGEEHMNMVTMSVNRYPGQEQIGGDARIPTILYYDELGVVQAAGAEALGDDIEYQAEANGWIKAECFNLHLHPNMTPTVHVTEAIPPLPAGKTAVQVFADFLKYLHACARKYIEETHSNGVKLWLHVQPATEVVLPHPNGWAGGQQNLMREAAIMAGVIPDTEDGRSRLFFVTEGEANLYFCIESGLLQEDSADKGILIVDAGQTTITINAYRRTPNTRSYAEIVPSQYIFKGSAFVTENAKVYFEQLLKGSRFETDITQITNIFDKKTKLTFVNPNDCYFIKFGRIADNAPELHIRAGQLMLTGHTVAQFFEPSISAIRKVVKDICAVDRDISTIFLVGEFEASQWLYDSLKDAFSTQKVCRPETHINKTVANGAVVYHLNHFASNCITSNSYVADAACSYNPDPHTHPHPACTKIDGGHSIAATVQQQDQVLQQDQIQTKWRTIEHQDGSEGRLNRVQESHLMNQQQDAPLHTEKETTEHQAGLEKDSELKEEIRIMNDSQGIAVENSLTSIEELKRVRDELSTQQQNRVLQHAQFQRSMERLEKELTRMQEKNCLLNELQRIAGESQRELEDELKLVQHELAAVCQKFQDLQDTHIESKVTAMEHRTVLENELKKLQEENRLLKDTQIRSEQAAVKSHVELQGFRKELEDSQQREQQLKGELTKYQTAIKALIEAVTSGPTSVNGPKLPSPSQNCV